MPSNPSYLGGNQVDQEITGRIFNEHSHDLTYDPRSGTYDEFDYEYRVRAMVQDARWYNDINLARPREIAARYYQGMEPQLDEEGRSTVVATEVRDTIFAIMPSLIRIFTGQERVCDFVPGSEQQAELADQQTDYVNYVFWNDNPGFVILHSVFKDALTKAQGQVRWWTDNVPEITTRDFLNLDREQFQYLISQEGVEIVRQQAKVTQDGETYDVTARISISKPITRIIAIPPDEFRIDRNAKSVCDSALVGHEYIASKSDLLKMGYPEDTIDRHRGASVTALRWNEERLLRNPGLEPGLGGPVLNDGILYGEYWIEIDEDGDGIAELHHICTMGDVDEIVWDRKADHRPVAMFCPDLEPHTALGHSITDLVIDLQKIKSNILRNSLDALASTIYPRPIVSEGRTNMDDVLNNEVGAPIRVKGDVQTAIRAFQEYNFDANKVAPFLQYIDLVRQNRTGISEASKGLDPKALQSTALKGVDMILQGAQERIELIARILAETGMKDMMKGLLREVTNNPAPQRTLKVRGKWVKYNVDQFDPDMSVVVNPAIGRGSDNDRFTILNAVKGTQEQIILKFGFDNPLCSPIEYRNTLEDMLNIAGFKNASRYFKQITPEQMQQLQQQQEQKAQQDKATDPAFMVAKNEQEKIRATTVNDVAKNKFNVDKLQKDDDFRHLQLRTSNTLKEKQIDMQRDVEMHKTHTNAETQRHVANTRAQQARESAASKASAE